VLEAHVWQVPLLLFTEDMTKTGKQATLFLLGIAQLTSVFSIAGWLSMSSKILGLF
jgi:hypothetical protein